MTSLALKSTKFTLDLATKFIKADVRTHNIGVIKPEFSIIFVVNHFTRLETILLPYQLHKETGLEPWSLAASDLFGDRIGSFILRKLGTVSTRDPHRDKVIISSLLSGDHPWIIFPEGAMIKDKKLVDRAGQFKVFSKGIRRPPHTGAAALALRAEYYREKLRCIHENPSISAEQLSDVLQRFGLESFEQAMSHRTVIIPVNITYYPIRAHHNLLLKFVGGIAKNLSERAVEELSIEGNIIAKDSDVDITFGSPIDIRTYLEQPAFAELMACSHDDILKLEEDPKSIFSETAHEIMLRYMSAIYSLTTVNFDHIFGTLMRNLKPGPFTERSYRNRIFLTAHDIVNIPGQRVHDLLRVNYREILYEDFNPKLNDFVNLCIQEKVIQRLNGDFIRLSDVKRGPEPEFHAIRRKELTQVIENEIEPLTEVTSSIKKWAQTGRPVLSKTIRELIMQEDQAIFERDYEKYCADNGKSPDVGRPFLLLPKKRIKAGIVLSHGYLAAPLEIRAMAEYFQNLGYAVYGVRLRGHGTSPEDLAQTRWEEWYESYNRGYAVIKSLTDDIIVGGFSFGGGLALLAGGRKREKVRAVFSINAPLSLKHYAAQFVSPVHTLNTMLRKMRRPKKEWEFLSHASENAHINYAFNPVAGLRQLGAAMDEMEKHLKDIVAPTMIIQGSRDPVVDQTSGRLIFSQIGTPNKELTIFERDRHGLVNGPDAIDLFNRIEHFLQWAFARSLTTNKH